MTGDLIPQPYDPEGNASMDGVQYHPDPEINAEVAQQTLDAEKFDLAAGYPPRRWTCPCGASHSRGHFGFIGNHRCLRCGYAGDDGVMED
jgi:hypothetical protein